MSMRTEVRDYLVKNYEVASDEVDSVLRSEDAKSLIAEAERFGSFAHYPGDKIADAQGWAYIGEDE